VPLHWAHRLRRSGAQPLRTAGVQPPDMGDRYYIFEVVDLWMSDSESSPSKRTAGGNQTVQGQVLAMRLRRSSLHSITREPDAVLVNAPTFGGWYLLQGKAGAISSTTDIHALPFSGLSRREGARGEIGVARIERSRTQYQKRCEHCGEGRQTTACYILWPAPLSGKHGEFGMTSTKSKLSLR
jgi:hypothetical protein